MDKKRGLFSITSAYLLLQYGILFGLLFVATAGLQWQPSFTALIFLSAAGLIAILTAIYGFRWLNISDILFALFLFVMLLSAAIQGFEKPWIAANMIYVPFLMVCPYLCGRFLRQSDLSILFRALPLLAILGILISIWLFATNSNSWLQYRPIINGTDEITARLANLIACAVLLIFLRLTWRTQQIDHYSILYSSVFIAGIVLLVFLGLRGILYACLVSIFLLLLKANWLGIKCRLIYSFLIAVVVIVSTMTMPMARHFNSAMFETIADGTSHGATIADGTSHGATIADGTSHGCHATQSGLNSVAIRFELGINALSDFTNSPIIGAGVGSYGQRACWPSLVAHPHNVVLQAFAELGLIGGGLIVIMLLIGIFKMLKKKWHIYNPGIAVPLLFSFSVLNSFINGNYFTSADFWWVIGAVGAFRLTNADSNCRM